MCETPLTWRPHKLKETRDMVCRREPFLGMLICSPNWNICIHTYISYTNTRQDVSTTTCQAALACGTLHFIACSSGMVASHAGFLSCVAGTKLFLASVCGSRVFQVRSSDSVCGVCDVQTARSSWITSPTWDILTQPSHQLAPRLIRSVGALYPTVPMQ